ncbi:MAG: hypothetical protein QOF70_7995 [Acetobacteraceae bacterium]|jgi:hypothetical protein|nr:hypothetical protein [Acetobacteraceae bacterium]
MGTAWGHARVPTKDQEIARAEPPRIVIRRGRDGRVMRTVQGVRKRTIADSLRRCVQK